MSAAIYQFAEVPGIGTELSLDAQAYVLIGLEPHERGDGEMTTLLVWQTHCAQCGVPFFSRSTVKVSSLNRRCQAHKRPGQRVGGKGRRSHLTVTVKLA